MAKSDAHLQVGGVIFNQMDQMDFTGPFEVLSRLPDSTFHVIGKDHHPISDIRSLTLTPTRCFADCPTLDVLIIPGGVGVDAVMEDSAFLDFIRRQAYSAKIIFSVCTGALICGVAGLLKGRQATTHWASFDLLAPLGATPVNERVVVDGNLVTAAGVTSGIDGALHVAALLRGEQVAREIQLYLQYAPKPPFDSGTPETSSPAVLEAVRASMQKTIEARRDLVSRLRLSEK